jgi:hypothetical protein
MILSSHHMSLSSHKPLNTYISILSILLTSPFIAFALLLIVTRSKKCLDHVATIHIIHILFCTLIFNFPTEIEYWITHIIAGTISTVAGEYLCMQREMATIQRSDEDSHISTGTGRGSSSTSASISKTYEGRKSASDKQQEELEMGVMNGTHHHEYHNDNNDDEHDRLLMSNGTTSNGNGTSINNTSNSNNNNNIKNLTLMPSLPRHTSTQSVEEIDLESGMSNAKLRVARPLLVSV